MEEKIKYVLNGETRYYTRQELKTYYIRLLKNSGIYINDDVDDEVDNLLERLKKYDGDPYGYITDANSRQHNHKMEAMGFFCVMY